MQQIAKHPEVHQHVVVGCAPRPGTAVAAAAVLLASMPGHLSVTMPVQGNLAAPGDLAVQGYCAAPAADLVQLLEGSFSATCLVT